MSKIWAIFSGSDWADASCNHVIPPDGLTQEEALKKYKRWYKNYFSSKGDMEYYSLDDFIAKVLGGRYPTSDELEIVEEY